MRRNRKTSRDSSDTECSKTKTKASRKDRSHSFLLLCGNASDKGNAEPHGSIFSQFRQALNTTLSWPRMARLLPLPRRKATNPDNTGYINEAGPICRSSDLGEHTFGQMEPENLQTFPAATLGMRNQTEKTLAFRSSLQEP